MYKSPVIFILLYGCGSWTLLADSVYKSPVIFVLLCGCESWALLADSVYKSPVIFVLLCGCESWALLADSVYKSPVIFILLYGCESWALLTDSEKGIQAFETKSLRKLSASLSRLYRQTRRLSIGIWNGSQHRREQEFDQ